nr:unnamed protein product [Callosobruchus analis]
MNNIILFNIDELDQGKPVREQTESDKTMVENILNNVDLEINNIKPIRRGNFNEAKKRPIKITVGNVETAGKIISSAEKLKTTNQFKHVNISFDRTKKQLAYYKIVKKELLDRLNFGETNCKIKHVNGVPRIVSEN